MTREEASKIIKDGIEDMSLDFADEEQYEALNMAIKALSQESSDDAISRKSVLDFIKECSLGGWVELPEEQWNEFVLSLPFVNPQEPFINKPCISQGVCREDKAKVLDKIRAEIDEQIKYNTYFNSDMAKGEIIAFEWVKRKIDEYTKGESE